MCEICFFTFLTKMILLLQERSHRVTHTLIVASYEWDIGLPGTYGWVDRATFGSYPSHEWVMSIVTKLTLVTGLVRHEWVMSFFE